MTNKAFYSLLSILIGLVGWVWITFYGKLIEIEKTMVEVKISLTQVQSEMMDEDKVRAIVEHELFKRGLIK